MAERSLLDVPTLVTDAKSRALRTAVQGVAIDIGVAVALVLYGATSGGDVPWALLPATIAKTVVHTGASYVMRRYGDPSSRISSPVPPSDPKQ